MAKTRLNKGHKHRMIQFALSEIKEDKSLKEKLETKRKATSINIQKAVKALYPTRDMNILRKYGAVRKHIDINIKLEEISSNLECFSLHDKLFIEVPSNTKWNKVFWLGPAIGKEVQETVKLAKDIYNQRRQIERDITQLVEICTTFEDAAERWPKFEDIRAEICFKSTALTTLDSTTLQRIQSYSTS